MHLHCITEPLHWWLLKCWPPEYTLNVAGRSITLPSLTVGSEATVLGSAWRYSKQNLLQLFPVLIPPMLLEPQVSVLLPLLQSHPLVPSMWNASCKTQPIRSPKPYWCYLIVGDKQENMKVKTSYLFWCGCICFLVTWVFLCQVLLQVHKIYSESIPLFCLLNCCKSADCILLSKAPFTWMLHYVCYIKQLRHH